MPVTDSCPDEPIATEIEETLAVSRATRAKLAELIPQLDECIVVLQAQIDARRKLRGVK